MALRVAQGELHQLERYLLMVIAAATRKFPLAITQAELAKLAGLSPNTVQRTLPKLQSKGLIKVSRQQLGRGIPDETLIWLLVEGYEQRRRQAKQRKLEESRAKRAAEFYPLKPKKKLPKRRREDGPETGNLFRD